MIINQEAEKAVIGAILLEGDRIAEISSSLKPDDFLLSECRTIYKVYLDMFRQNIPIDGTTLKTYLPAPEAEDLMLFAVHAAEDLLSLSAVPTYVKIIQEGSMRRKAKDKMLTLSEAIDYESPISECEEKASDLLQCFNSSLSGAESLSAKDGFLAVYDSLGKEKQYIKTGISWIDRYVFIEPGYFFIIGGRPSSGKTALSLQIASYVSDQYKTVYFSLETSPEVIYSRMVSSFTGTPMEQIKKGSVSDNQAAYIGDRFSAFSIKQLDVIKASGFTVERIRSEIIRRKAKVAFIDYLTIIQAEGRTMLEKATNISIGLHNVAQQTGCVIFALSQLNRSGDKEPDMTSLRESGQIEQDADVVLIIQRSEETSESRRRLSIQKNKEGLTGGRDYSFDGSTQTFSETDYYHEGR